MNTTKILSKGYIFVISVPSAIWCNGKRSKLRDLQTKAFFNSYSTMSNNNNKKKRTREEVSSDASGSDSEAVPANKKIKVKMHKNSNLILQPFDFRNYASNILSER